MSGIMAGTAVLGAGGGGGGGSAATVTIQDETLVKSGTDSSVYSGYALTNNGHIRQYIAPPAGSSSYTKIGEWCSPTGDIGDFEVRCTIVSQSKALATGSSAVDTWLSFPAPLFPEGLKYQWLITDTLANGAAEEAVLTIEIRDKVTLLVRDTATITIRANRI